MEKNIVTLTDSYKFGHWAQYPDGTEHVYSYFESRTGARFSEVVFFGLQYFLKEYLAGVRVNEEGIEEARQFSEKHFGNPGIFNLPGWEHILQKHSGRLPVRIKAVPEGTVVPVNNVLMTVENTDPACFWLTNHLETVLSQVWYPCTVATLSRKTKLMMSRMLKETGGDPDAVNFMLHDFGFRGVSSVESAGLGGSAHLINFLGTDTVRAIEFAMKYYDADVCAFSVPASEHSVMTSLGEAGERDMFLRMLRVYPTGIVSIVSDSYDIFRATKEYICGAEAKKLILEREGKVVIRPDSGDPISTVLKLLDILDDGFGTTITDTGHRLLNPKVGLIWGDGIDYDGIYDILRAMSNYGWCSSNIVFGMGGGLLQKINRDTQRFAFKCSAQKRNGQWFDIFKEPLDKSKTSKKGKLALYKDEFGKISTYSPGLGKDLLTTVFEDGEIKGTSSFEDIRARASDQN